MVFLHHSVYVCVSDENKAGGGDGGVKIKRQQKKAWRMKKRGENDRGDKTR